MTQSLIAAASALFAGIAFLVAYYGIRELHKWNRRQPVLVLAAEARRHAEGCNKILRDTFPDLFDDHRTTKLSRADAENLYVAGSKGEPQRPGARQFTADQRRVAMEHLNFLEYIAVAYWYQVADRRMVDVIYGGILRQDYDYFENFIRYLQEKRGAGVWKPFEQAVQHMRHRLRDPGKGPSPTASL